jgi:hypothetical protein
MTTIKHTKTVKFESIDNIDSMIDITQPEFLEVIVRYDGKVVWINVDGICRFRACRLNHLEINDGRKKEISQQCMLGAVKTTKIKATKQKTKPNKNEHTSPRQT